MNQMPAGIIARLFRTSTRLALIVTVESCRCSAPKTRDNLLAAIALPMADHACHAVPLTLWDLSSPTLLDALPSPIPNASWKSLRDHLLPNGVAGNVHAYTSETGLFPFFSPGVFGVLGSSGSPDIVPRPPADLQAPIGTVLSRMKCMAASCTGRGGSFTYYSARMAEVRAGRLVQAVHSPVGEALGSYALAVAPRTGTTALAHVWLGSTAACTPLHYDAAANVLTQVLGEKIVTLYPPEAVAAAGLMPWASTLQRSARTGWDGVASARAAIGGHVARIFRLAPGDALLIPAYWLHHVCAVGESNANGSTPSLSVSLWAESAAQLEARALLAEPLPAALTGRYSDEDHIAIVTRLFVLISGRYANAAAAALRSRYAGLQKRSDHSIIVCSRNRNVLDEEGSKMWLMRASRALAAQVSTAARIIVIANWAEEALLRALRMSRAPPAAAYRRALQQASLANTVLACFQHKNIE